MGLKADLIRLQREEVALRVAMLAAQRVKHQKKADHTDPNEDRYSVVGSGVAGRAGRRDDDSVMGQPPRKLGNRGPE